MAERGSIPEISNLHRRAFDALRLLCTPLVADDYLDLFNPLWSTRELRGRIERIEPETPQAATIHIRPGHKWRGHRAGQYLRIGVSINGVNHWRAYSLTSPPQGENGCVSITPKAVERGTVSQYLVREACPGEVVRLGGVEGTFVLPEPVPEQLLFISAGSGITPIVSMLGDLHRRKASADIVHIHSVRTEEEVIFNAKLREFAAANKRIRLHLHLTGRAGRLSTSDLDGICPDWRDRYAFASGPSPLLDELVLLWERRGEPSRLKTERFQPLIGEAGLGGEGGSINFVNSEVEVDCDGSTPILVKGEEAGVLLPSGCRMGICHTCVGELCAGTVRDLRTGEISGMTGERVRTCVNAPEGPIEIAF